MHFAHQTNSDIFFLPSHSSPPLTIHVIFWLILWFVILFSLHHSLSLPQLTTSIGLNGWPCRFDTSNTKHQPPTQLPMNVRGLKTQTCLGPLGKFMLFLSFLYCTKWILLLAMADTSCQHQHRPTVTPTQDRNDRNNNRTPSPDADASRVPLVLQHYGNEGSEKSSRGRNRGMRGNGRGFDAQRVSN